MVRILKTDRYQKGEDEIAETYGSADEAVRAIRGKLFRK